LKVRAWEREGRPSGYSAAAWWEMGCCRRRIGGGVDYRKRAEPLSEGKMFEDDPVPCSGRVLLEKRISRAGPM